MDEKVKRLYAAEDEAIITRAAVMLQHLQENLPAFTAKFPWLDVTYVNQFESDINAARQFPVDQQVLGHKKVLTEEMQNAMKEGDTALRNLGVYARLTYPTDPERRYVFGQKQWSAARNNRKKMFDALTLAYSLATQEPYKTNLAAKGYSAADADVLRDNAIVLEERKIPQGKARKERNISTADRIILFNEVWKKMKVLKLCARLVYRDSSAKRDLFLLYKRKQEKKE